MYSAISLLFAPLSADTTVSGRCLSHHLVRSRVCCFRFGRWLCQRGFRD